MMTLAGVLLGGKRFLASLLDFLKSPAGIVVLAGVLYGVGYWHGSNAGEEALERAVLEARQAAAEADRRIADEAAKKKAEIDAEMTRFRENANMRIRDYEQELRSRGRDGCSLLDDDLIRLQPFGADASRP